MKPYHFLDALAWLIGAGLYVAFVFAAIDAELVCFDVLQGRSVPPDSAASVRRVIFAGMVLLFALPALHVLVSPLIGFMDAWTKRQRQARKVRASSTPTQIAHMKEPP